MIQFEVYPYALEPVVSLNSKTQKGPRSGALLKMKWPDSKVGYADVFPWPELGDDPLPYHLGELEQGRTTSLVGQAIELGRKDALLRSEGTSALKNASVLKNHYTVADWTSISDAQLNLLQSQGVTSLKVKVGRDWPAEITWLAKVARQNNFHFRLDLNSHEDFSGFEKKMQMLPVEVKQRLEFVEDPFPFDTELWAKASNWAPLAVDFEYDHVPWDSLSSVPFQVLVIKPARQNIELAVQRARAHDLQMVVTSSMDHPVGVAHALSVAAALKLQYPDWVLDCGCMTTPFYKSNAFSEEIRFQGPFVVPTSGVGVGFDEIFKKLPWKALGS